MLNSPPQVEELLPDALKHGDARNDLTIILTKNLDKIDWAGECHSPLHKQSLPSETEEIKPAEAGFVCADRGFNRLKHGDARNDLTIILTKNLDKIDWAIEIATTQTKSPFGD